MQLVEAFRIREKEVVSLVGGGGKTTAMFRLAEELVAQQKRVVTTTTTRIFAAQIKLAPFHIFAADREQTLRDLRTALKEHSHVLVIGATNEEGKAIGIEPTLVDEMVGLEEVDVVIVEADGSRMRPFKAPGEHEPAVPASTTLLVPVVGIEAPGAPLDEAHVHRPERAAALAGVPIGTSVEPEMIVRVLTHPDGGLKHRPAQARVVTLINKVENEKQILLARELASRLLESNAIESVVIGAVRNAEKPVAELRQRTAAVILAAGGSTRMQGVLKQLLPWGDSTLVRHTAQVALDAQVSEVIVVVGKQGAEVRKELASLNGVRIVENADWMKGRSTSVRAGIAAVGENIAAAIFINADQPFLTPLVIDAIILRHAQTLAPIVVPNFEGKTGSPVLFARELFVEFESLEGEDGGKRIMERHRGEMEEAAILDASAGVDIDTPEDYQAALMQAKAIA